MKQMFNRNVFAEEFISLVLRIISPDLKPVLPLLSPSIFLCLLPLSSSLLANHFVLRALKVYQRGC
jgi:hypothetical protein